MKIYLFDPENGVYEGESFDEGDIINLDEGITAIAPPDYEHGQVPVFDRQRQAWEVIPLTLARQLLNQPRDSTKGDRS